MFRPFVKRSLFFLIFIFPSSDVLAGYWPNVEAENPQEARALEQFFATVYENEVEPVVNWDSFTRLYERKGGPVYGKAWLMFDIGPDGLPKNLQVLKRNKDLLFGTSLKKLFEKSFQFPENRPKKDVIFEIGFCGRTFCKIKYERVGGPAEPLILGYDLPFDTFKNFKKGACSDLVVKFDVNKRGRAVKAKIISSTNPGQFEVWLKESIMGGYRFEKNKPAEGIELLVRIQSWYGCDS